MPVVRQALRRLIPLSLLLVLAGTAVGVDTHPGAAANGPDRDAQLRFMWAMAGQESGWDYYARNASSGAYGKYQIMPFNCPVWAEKYLGDRHAEQTPWNQEQVAYGKLRDLHIWLGSWKRVAYWWLTGSTEKDQRRWSDYATDYVTDIMALRKRAPSQWKMPKPTSSKARKGDWRRSAAEQKLRRSPGGAVWSARGALRDGQVLKVRATARRGGLRWIGVVTADGRLGWLKQLRTVPAHHPNKPRRWRDVTDRGQVRPRPK